MHVSNFHTFWCGFDNDALWKLRARRKVASAGGGSLQFTLLCFSLLQTLKNCTVPRLFSRSVSDSPAKTYRPSVSWSVEGGGGRARIQSRRTVNLCASLLNALRRRGNDAMPALTQLQCSQPRPGEERYRVLMGLSLIASWGLSPALGPKSGRLAQCSWNRIRQARGNELQPKGGSTRSDAEGRRY